MDRRASLTHRLRWLSALLVALTLVGCGNQAAIEEPPSPPEAVESEPETPSEPEEPVIDAEVETDPEEPATEAEAETETEEPTTEAETETEPELLAEDTTVGTPYQGPNDLYAIVFPEGYTHTENDNTVTFISADEGFEGFIEVEPSEGEEFTTTQLEEALKGEFEKRYDDIAWQGSEIQPDGSLRIDWVGRNKGNDLDAITFIEQRGGHVFILNLMGVNTAYSDYEADAGELINSYQIEQ